MLPKTMKAVRLALDLVILPVFLLSSVLPVPTSVAYAGPASVSGLQEEETPTLTPHETRPLDEPAPTEVTPEPPWQEDPATPTPPPDETPTNQPTQSVTHSITGMVVGADAQPVSGVAVSLNGDATFTTGVDGAFIFTDLVENTYTIVPIMEGMVFEPASWTVNLPSDSDDVVFTAMTEVCPVSDGGTGVLLEIDLTAGVVVARGFLDGEAISMTIMGQAGEIKATGVGPAAAVDGGEVLVTFDSAGVALQPGDELQLTGECQSRSLVIPALAVTGFDFEYDTISGKADPGGLITAQVEINGALHMRSSPSDEHGAWLLDFGSAGENGEMPVDLQPGMNGKLTHVTAAGDTLLITWQFEQETQPPVEDQPVVAMDGAPAASPLLRLSNGYEEIIIEWDAVDGADHYEVHRAAGVNGTRSLLGTVGNPGYYDTAVAGGAQYAYWVRACAGAACGPFSQPVSGAFGLSAPPGVTASDGTDLQKVALAWRGIKGASSYRVFRTISPMAVDLLSETDLLASTTGLTHADTSAEPGQLYHYHVQACRDGTCGPVSRMEDGWRGLPVPVGLIASSGTQADGVRLTWMPVPFADRYAVFRSISSKGTKTQLGTVTATEMPEYIDSTAVTAASYSYWIKACRGLQCSNFSAAVIGWRGLNPPANLSAADGTSTSRVEMTWDGVPEASGYQVFRSMTIDGARTLVGTTVSNAFVDQTAGAAIHYFYRVKACIGSRCSEYSAADAGHRNMPAPLVHATDGTLADRVNISWAAVGGAGIYTITRAESLTGEQMVLGTKTSTSFSDFNTAPGVSYFYRVTACKSAAPDAACSPASEASGGWRGLPAPTAVSAADGEYSENVAITWTGVSGDEGVSYRISRATSSKGEKQVLAASPAVMAGNLWGAGDYSAIPGNLYTYWVQACVGDNCSAYSSPNTGWLGLATPVALSASDRTSSNAIDLTWIDVYGATTYQVYRSTGSSRLTLIASVASTSYSDRSAAAITTYTYWVKACNGSRCSDFSLPDNGQRNLPAPSVTVSAGSDLTGNVITWPAVAGANNYRITRSETIGGYINSVDLVISRTYVDTHVEPGKIYHYMVQPCFGFVPNAICGEVSAPAPGWRGIPAPTGLVASDGLSSEQVNLSWTGVGGIPELTYRVFRSVGTSAPKVPVDTSPRLSGGTVWIAEDTGSVPGVASHYWVQACRGEYCSQVSLPDTGWRTLNPPEGLIAGDGTSALGVPLSWNSVAGALTYQVFRSPAGQEKYARVGKVTVQSFLDRGAVIGVTYDYRVKACSRSYCTDLSASDEGYRVPGTAVITATDGTLLDRVNIAWPAVSGANTYIVTRADSEGGEAVVLANRATVGYVDFEVQPGISHYYQVQACKVSGVVTVCGPPSAINSGWRGVAIPSSLDATDGASLDHVQLSWNGVGLSGDLTYRVSRAARGQSVKDVVDGEASLISENRWSLNDTGAIPGMVYTYWVQACMGENCSAFSTATSGWRAIRTVTGLAASDESSTSAVDLTWEVVEGAKSYAVYRAATLAGARTLLGNVASNTFTDRTAIPGQAYFYRVSACRDRLCGNISEADEGRRRVAQPELTASDGAVLDGVSLSWRSVSGATHYQVYRSASEEGEKTLLADQTTTVWKDRQVEPGVTHYYWVLACRGAVCGDFNPAQTGWRGIPVPLRLTASDGSQPESASLAWSAVSGVGGVNYQIYRSLTRSSPSLIGSADGTDYEDTTGEPGRIYNYWVKACVGDNCSVFSGLNAGWRGFPAPVELSASDGESSAGVNLTWAVVPGATAYRVYRAGSPAGSRALIKTIPSASHVDTTARAGVAYYYFVQACHNANCGILSAAEAGHRGLPAVARLSATDGAYTYKVGLSWGAVSGATGYRVYRSTSADGDFIPLGTVSGNTYADLGAAAGVIHYYQISPCKGGLCGAAGSVESGWKAVAP